MEKPQITDRPEHLEAIAQASVDAINAERAARRTTRMRRSGHPPMIGTPKLNAPRATTIRQTVKAANREGRGEKGRKRTASVIKLYGALANMGFVRIVRHHHRAPRIIFQGGFDVTEPLQEAMAAA